MAVNLSLLTAAAPYIIDAANRILTAIKRNKQEKTLEDRVLNFDEKLALFENRQEEWLAITEEQSKVIRDLAEQNQKLILAVRNTRIVSIAAIVLAIFSLILIITLRGF